MSTNKKLIALLLALMPIAGFASFDDDELVEIKLHSTTPSGSHQHAPELCNIRCMYDAIDDQLYVYADDTDYYGTQIIISNLNTQMVEYSHICSTSILNEEISLYESADYCIEVTTITGKTYFGIFSTQ